MGYSARRGFTNGSMKMTGAQRQAEMQARIQQMQEQVTSTVSPASRSSVVPPKSSSVPEKSS